MDQNGQIVTPSVLRSGDFDNDHLVETQRLHHGVDQANEINTLYEDGNRTTFVNDPAGNLTFDGQYVYQYDP